MVNVNLFDKFALGDIVKMDASVSAARGEKKMVDLREGNARAGLGAIMSREDELLGSDADSLLRLGEYALSVPDYNLAVLVS